MEHDAELLDAWRNGHKESGQRLFQRHYDRVVSFFKNKLGDDYEDAVQETFMGCVKGRERIRDDRAFRPYLFGIARNILFQRLQDRYGLREDQLGSLSIHDIAPGLSTVMHESERKRLLAEALRRLPVELQIVLELTYREELTSSEVGAVLEAPASTIRDRLGRAKKALANALRTMRVTEELIEQTMDELEAGAGQDRDPKILQ